MAQRKRETEKIDKSIGPRDNIVPIRTPGRPPRDPRNKMGYSIRSMVTIGVVKALEASANLHGIELSDAHRLALYRLFEADGLMTPELRKDSSWDNIKLAGLV